MISYGPTYSAEHFHCQLDSQWTGGITPKHIPLRHISATTNLHCVVWHQWLHTPDITHKLYCTIILWTHNKWGPRNGGVWVGFIGNRQNSVPNSTNLYCSVENRNYLHQLCQQEWDTILANYCEKLIERHSNHLKQNGKILRNKWTKYSSAS